MNLSTALEIHAVSPLTAGSITLPARYDLSDRLSWTEGTGAEAVAFDWATLATLTTGTPTDLDLTALTDRLGRSVSFAKVRCVVLRAPDTNAADVTINAAGATNPWTANVGTLVLKPGQLVIAKAPGAAGLPVSGGNKVLRLTGTTADQVEVYLAGE